MQKDVERDGSSGGRALVVSIHDVSPRTFAACRQIRDDLASAGIDRVSLLLVPDHHGLGLASADGPLCQWLRERRAAGDEIVQHGYLHQRDARPREGVTTRIITRSYTAGEGEFFDISSDEAARRIAAGREVLEACGVRASGFIAPAWLLGGDGERAVRDAGFDYTTRIGGVLDLVAGRHHASRSLVWSVRSGWRRFCSILWNSLLEAFESGNTLLRIGIHPPDWNHPIIRAQIIEIIGRALAGRKAMTYEEWLARFRAHR